MAGPDAADRVELSTREVARLLASGMRDELLTIMREMSGRNAYAGRSPTALTRPLNCRESP